jgi:hypothetical protein
MHDKGIFPSWSGVMRSGILPVARVPGRRALRSLTLIVLRRSSSNRRQRGSSRQCDDDRKAHGVSLHEQSYALTFFQIVHGIIWTPAGSCARQDAAGSTIYNQQAHKGRAGPLNEKAPASVRSDRG